MNDLYDLYDLYDLAHVTEWEPYSGMIENVFPGLDLRYIHILCNNSHGTAA